MTGSLAVMQPAFLPWAGYFNLMAQSDDFVFLDDVQLEKQSWQTRNRLIIGGAVRWITVPIRNACLAQTVSETEVLDAARWREKLARGFEINYGRHPHYAAAREVIDVMGSFEGIRLGGLNEHIIRFIAGNLGLTSRLHRASELGKTGSRSMRLVALCDHFSAREYLSPVGAAQYLSEDGFATQSPSTLRFQTYSPGVYPQKGLSSFQSHLSILDVIANLGWADTKTYVRMGCL